MAPVAKRIEITQDQPGVFDLIIDGQPFAFSVARRRVDLETAAGRPPLYVLNIPVFCESVVGLEEFNAVMDEENSSKLEKLSIVVPVSSGQEVPEGESLLDLASDVARKKGMVLVGEIHYDGVVDPPVLGFEDLKLHSYSVQTKTGAQ